MEAGAERAQGHVELGREYQQKERRLEFHAVIQQAETNLHGDDGCAEGGQQFQRQCRKEGDAQHAQCGVTELVADLRDGAGLSLGLTEELQRGQALQAVEEVRAEQAQGFVLAFGDGLCALADHDHKEGNQRRGDQEDDARQQVDGENKDEDREGNEGGDDQLRQVLAKVGIQRLDALDRGGGQLAGALSARVGGTQLEDVREEPLAQVGLDLDRHGIGGDFVQPGQEGAPADGDQDPLQEGRHIGEGLSQQEHVVDRGAEQPGLPDGQQAGQEARQDGQGQGNAGVAGQL